jgi:hypothetical protein
MRTAILFIILSALLSFLIFLKITSESALVVTKYVGVMECKGCHSVNQRGNQYGIWAKSKHSKATLTLRSEKALRYSKQQKVIDPIRNESCLKCHTTSFGESRDRITNHFNIEDGIQCEECHNPGSEYSKYEIMVSREKFISMGGEISNKLKCYKCHSPSLANKNFNKCPFQRENFNYQIFLNKIEHPIPKETK